MPTHGLMIPSTMLIINISMAATNPFGFASVVPLFLYQRAQSSNMITSIELFIIKANTFLVMEKSSGRTSSPCAEVSTILPLYFSECDILKPLYEVCPCSNLEDENRCHSPSALRTITGSGMDISCPLYVAMCQ